MENQNTLEAIGNRLLTQDNRMTENPMFCVQRKVREIGYDSDYSDNLCWTDSANEETIFDDDKDFRGPPEGDEWDEFGYRDRWETVQVSFTEEGAKRYLELDGHNLGETRIYVASFNRCPEMVALREFLMGYAKQRKEGGVHD